MQSTENKHTNTNTFHYLAERFEDLQLLRYRVPQFAKLSPEEKRFAYYLSQAAYSGRDIIYDQRYKHNLWIRNALETLYSTTKVDRQTSPFRDFANYLKRLWFSNGIHHHYSTHKFYPSFSRDYLYHVINHTPDSGLENLNTPRNELYTKLSDLLFAQKDTKGVELNSSKDLLQHSANNFYEGITQQEAEAFYKQFPGNGLPHGLNSKLGKNNGATKEYVWHANGMYGPAIRKIVYWLKLAAGSAPTNLQRQALEKLVEFYETGSLQAFNEYNLLWLQDTNPKIDTINGFIEVYGDPLGIKGSWEGLVLIRDDYMTEKLGILSHNAQWFENQSPIADAHKKQTVTGVSYNVVEVLAGAGDSSPTSPIGINLPNADWIRAQHGSKSVSLGNIEDSYHEVSKQDGTLEEFYLPEQASNIRAYGQMAFKLLVGLHEVVGHGSGKLEEHVGNPSQTLKNHANTIEEARADLVALYFLPDAFLEEHGLTDNAKATGKAAYDEYMVNGLMLQLKRIAKGDNLEEAHMKNRQLIASRVYEKAQKNKAIEAIRQNGKTYFRIRDYEMMRQLFGQLLREIQRIKSQGDYAAAAKLVEGYGTQVNSELHEEVLKRYTHINQAPYSGFINPHLEPRYNAANQLVDVGIDYPENFTDQMLYYSKSYGYL